MNSIQTTACPLELGLKGSRHSAFLQDQTHESSFVWNYCNDMSFKEARQEGRCCLNFKLNRPTAGAIKESLPHSHSVRAIKKRYRCITRWRQSSRVKPSPQLAHLLRETSDWSETGIEESLVVQVGKRSKKR